MTRIAMLLTLGIGLTALPVMAADRTAIWRGGQGFSGYDDTSNWMYDPAIPLLNPVPDNIDTGDSWTLVFDEASVVDGTVFFPDNRIEYTVTDVAMTATNDLFINFQTQSGQFFRLNVLNEFNVGANVEIETQVGVGGNVVNDGVFVFFSNGPFGVQIDGSFLNRGEIFVDESNAELVGPLNNLGEVIAALNSIMFVGDGSENSGTINILDSTFGAEGTITNNVDGVIRGFGTILLDGEDDGMVNPTSLVNQGTVETFGGDLAIQILGGPLANAGTLRNAPGASILIDAASVNHTGVIEVFSAGAVAFNTELVNQPGADIRLLGGTLGAAGGLVNTPTADFIGFGNITADVSNQPGALMELIGDTQIVGALDNDGQVDFRNGDLLVLGPAVNDGTINAVGGNLFFEGGIINNNTLNTVQAIAVGGDILNNGAIQVGVDSTANFYGVLSGTGNVNGPGAAVIHDELAPGNSPGVMNFGGALTIQPGASLTVELGGTIGGAQHDQINVAGALTLGGELFPMLIDGYVPGALDTFTIVTFDSLAGDFSVIHDQQLDNDLLLIPDIQSKRYDLVAAIPGDFTLDGVVGVPDLIRWAQNFGAIDASFQLGDA
ncbi:MAG: hypothetical protein ACYTGQ_03000, partial [Planctomycetota bacterium]